MAARIQVATIVLSLVSMLVNIAVATDHAIGGPNGWNIKADLQTWASSEAFSVGDNLVFQYPSAFHDVVEVSKAEFESCRAIKPMAIYSNGNTVVPLTSPGKRYFICAMADHCNQGMKLEINTVPADPTSPNATQSSPLPLIPSLQNNSNTLPPIATSPSSLLPSISPPSTPLPLIPGFVPTAGPSGSPSLPDLVPVQDPSLLIPTQSPGSSSLPLFPGSPSSGFTKTSGSLPSTTTTAGTVTSSPPSLESSATVKSGPVKNLVTVIGLALMILHHVI